MKRALHIIILFTLLWASASCKSVTVQGHKAIKLYSKNNILIKEITETEAIKSIEYMVENRKKTFVKILPIYTHYFVLTVENKQETWKISGLGYMQRHNHQNKQLFRIKLPGALLNYISKS